MPIFTFMGANILRLDDAYSFRVIDKTVQMVIPALIQVRGRLPQSAGQPTARQAETCVLWTKSSNVP